jgi:hypothetical protein
MAPKEVEGPMKLTVPAIRAAEPNVHRQEVAENIGRLLEAIDSVLAESFATNNGYKTGKGRRVGMTGSADIATIGLRRIGGHGPGPVPPAAA